MAPPTRTAAAASLRRRIAARRRTSRRLRVSLEGRLVQPGEGDCGELTEAGRVIRPCYLAPHAEPWAQADIPDAALAAAFQADLCGFRFPRRVGGPLQRLRLTQHRG